MFSRRQARYGTLPAASVLVVLGILVADQLHRRAAEQALGPDRRQAVQPVGSDPQRPHQARLAAADARVRPGARVPALPRPAEGIRVRRRSRSRREYIDPDKKPTLAQQNQVQQYGTIVFNYKGRTERVTTDTEQDITNGIIKVGQRAAAEGLLHPGPRREGHRPRPSATATAPSATRSSAKTTPSRSSCSRSRARCPTMPRSSIVAGPQTDFFPPEIDALKKYLEQGRQAAARCSIRRTRRTARRSTNLIALAHDWGIDVGNNIVVDASGMGRLIGTDASVPVAANYPSHPITERFNVLTAYPAGAVGHAGQRRRQRPHRADLHRDGSAKLGRSRHQGAARHRRGVARRGEGRQAGPGRRSAAAVSAAAAPADAAEARGQADAPKPETRVVVVGDSDFAANGVPRHSGQSRPVHEHRSAGCRSRRT